VVVVDVNVDVVVAKVEGFFLFFFIPEVAHVNIVVVEVDGVVVVDNAHVVVKVDRIVVVLFHS